MRVRAGRERPEDRLATAIFIAALVHGLVILGVRFSAPPTPDDKPLPTLEVLLVPDGPRGQENPEASYIAERSQKGAGTTRDHVRTSLPEVSATLLDNPGEQDGDAPRPDATTGTTGSSQLLAARSASSRQTLSGDQSDLDQSAAIPLETRPIAQVGINAQAADESLRLRGAPGTNDRLLADTRESQIAGYLDGWKRRIERAGTLNFPNEARRRSLSGNPVLEVAIRADGSLEQVIVRRSSGHSELDNAAVGIVRLASPFDPFPPTMRERYPVLRFAYEWQFIGGRLGDGSVWPGPP
jgi:protein TonB